MPAYQLWVLDAAYAKLAYIRDYAQLEYKLVLNGLDWARLEMLPNDAKIAELLMGRRLLIVRNGAIVFHGRMLREGWQRPETAPAGETWAVWAYGGAHYAKRRYVVPASGQEYDTRTDNADDVAKDYVYYHCGGGAAAARQFADLTVAADANAAGSLTWDARYSRVYDVLDKLRLKGGFDWRFVPTASGYTFTTAYPQWGLDRTKGNGVNDEMVFQVDRRNFRRMGYEFDASELENYAYVAGQGEGADRTVRERSDATSITAYGRCEAFVDARDLQLAASLDARGDSELAKRAARQSMSVLPTAGLWPGSFGLGDLVTIQAYQWERTFAMDAKVVALDVKVTAQELELVTPEVEES